MMYGYGVNPANPKALPQLRQYNVNRAGQFEVIWQPTYDYLTYPAAGASEFTFFQRAKGSGGTTFADTNMLQPGAFPRPQEFLVVGIQVYFNPGGPVGFFGAQAAQENWNDVTDIANNGFVQLTVGSKPYLQDAPVGKFSTMFTTDGRADQANASTAAANQLSYVDYARQSGRYYAITPIKIPSNQNFDVQLTFPTVVPIAADGRIGVILDGFLYRLSQ